MERHPRYSPAPGARALRRASLDGRNGTSTGAIPRERETSELGRSIVETWLLNARSEDYPVTLPRAEYNKNIAGKNMNRVSEA